MKLKTTSERLKELMAEKNLKQSDVLRLVKPFCEAYDVKMNKSDISQYVSGKVAPSQTKLVVLGMALGVSESWLMGIDDVPKERKDNAASAISDFEHLNKYNQLSERDKQIIDNMIDTMLSNKEGGV